jgi:hypothetical protein
MPYRPSPVALTLSRRRRTIYKSKSESTLRDRTRKAEDSYARVETLRGCRSPQRLGCNSQDQPMKLQPNNTRTAILIALLSFAFGGMCGGQSAPSTPATSSTQSARQPVDASNGSNSVGTETAVDSESKLLLELAKLASKSSQPDHIGDLIKIGLPILGAIVAAIISLLATKRAAETQRQTTLDVTNANRKTELTKELGNRRAQRFDALTSSFDSFCQKLTAYVTSVENAIETKDGSGYSAQQLSVIEKYETDFSSAFLDLLNAESKLLVMGHADLQKQFREFGEQAQGVYSTVHIRDPQLTVEQIEEKMKALRKLRLELLVSLGDAERKWWTT